MGLYIRAIVAGGQLSRRQTSVVFVRLATLLSCESSSDYTDMWHRMTNCQHLAASQRGTLSNPITDDYLLTPRRSVCVCVCMFCPLLHTAAVCWLNDLDSWGRSSETENKSEGAPRGEPGRERELLCVSEYIPSGNVGALTEPAQICIACVTSTPTHDLETLTESEKHVCMNMYDNCSKNTSCYRKKFIFEQSERIV